MTGTERAPSATSRTTVVVCLVHSVLFLLGCWVALVTSGQFLGGAFDAAPFFPVLAVIAIGAVRAAAGAAGGRALLAVGDLGLAGLLAEPLVFSEPRFRALPAAWYLVGAALALVAAIVAFAALPRPNRGRVVRTPRDGFLLAVLVIVDLAVAVWNALTTAAGAELDVGSYLAQVLATTAPVDLAVFGAWWWGSRWPLGLTGAAGLVVGLGFAVTYGADLGRWVLVLGPNLLAIVAASRGPALDELRADPAPAVGEDRATGDAGLGRSRPSDVWIAIGAIAYPFLGLWGHFPIVLDACLECGPRFPGDTLVWTIGVATLLVVPIVAFLAVAGGARPASRRAFLPLLIASAAVVLFEILAGQAGVARFAFLGLAAPSILLVGLGAVVGLRRPWWLDGAGAVAAVAAAVLVWAWTWGIRPTFGTPTAGSFVFSAVAYAMAAAAALAIARDSARVRSGGWVTASGGPDPAREPQPELGDESSPVDRG